MAQTISNLPIGAKIKFGKHQVNNETPWDIMWTVVAKNHSSAPAYPTNSVTLHATNIVDLRCFDAGDPNLEDDRRRNGSNNYEKSNIHKWLNSRATAGNWHTGDDQSPTKDYVTHGTEYAHRPGFLYSFSDKEYNAILDTTIRVVLPLTDTGGSYLYKDIVAKVFLPSIVEAGLGVEASMPEGATWNYYANGAVKKTSIAPQAYANTLSTYKPSTVDTPWSWWLRTPQHDKTNTARIVLNNDTISQNGAYTGQTGIRPAFNLSASTKVSDTTDSEGCYTIVWNTAPFIPTSLNTPSAIYGGKTNTISWSQVTDPEGDTVTYQLECAVNNGGYTQIYSGNTLSYAHLVPFGTSTVSYRVKATDPSGESSAYTTSTTINVINNNAPVISGSDTNLGVKSDDFTGTYTITDANGNTVTVTEAIDGVRIRSLVATLGQPITYGVTENTWLALPNGSHTLTISATDGIDTTVRTIVFTKLVESFKIQNSTPWVSSTMPSRIMLVVTRNIPSTSNFKVEVCNNGYDSSPTWEDCTDAVRSGLVHVFTNQKKSSTNWGVLVRVTVERNGATGACYVSAIGGNFE